MPLFGRRENTPPPVVVEQPRKSGGLFSRHHEPAPVVTDTRSHHSKRHSTSSASTTSSSGGGLFGRRRSSASPAHSPVSTTSRHSTSSTHSRTRSLLHSRNAEDPSIVGARERVYAAEAAERQADKALLGARSAVKDARDHVKRLEREAAEDARLAMLKQNQAASISKRAKPLGRHGL